MGHAQMQLPMQLLQQRDHKERSELLRVWGSGAWSTETLPGGGAHKRKEPSIRQSYRT